MESLLLFRLTYLYVLALALIFDLDELVGPLHRLVSPLLFLEVGKVQLTPPLLVGIHSFGRVASIL